LFGNLKNRTYGMQKRFGRELFLHGCPGFAEGRIIGKELRREEG